MAEFADAHAVSTLGSDKFTHSPSLRHHVRWIGVGVTVTIAYVVAAQVGFRVALVAEQVTTVWAPTGIALAALLLGGLRFAPAVWVGAFLANAVADAPAWTAVFVATGNTAEALAAAWGLRRLLPHFDVSFRRVPDVLAYAAIAAGLCTMLSATIGVVSLCAAGVEPWARFPELWFAWWLGDALGALVVAPAILTTVRQPSWSRRDLVTAATFVGGTLIITQLAFGQAPGFSAHPLEYVIFPLVVAGAVRGGPAVTALVVFSASTLAIVNTVRGDGPFAGADLHQSLILLQAFMGVMAITALVLAAAIAERESSERRERDAARVLRHREQMLTLAQRAGGVATFEWDFRNQVAQCSEEFFRTFGLPGRNGVMTGAEWGAFVHADDRARMAAHLARAVEGAEPAVADYRITAADGTVRWLSYAGQLQKTPTGERLLGTVVDISERKKLEAGLRDSQDVLSLAMRGGGMGAWSRNLITNEVWWSRELEEIVGLQPGGFNRTEDGFFEFVHEDDRHAVQDAVQAAVKTGSDYAVEFRFWHASGEWRWMEGRGRAVSGAGGAPRTLYGIGIDVTARKRFEMDLERAKTAAESANQLKDQFLATLSHELRTPLNAILGYARMLHADTIAPEKRQRAIEVIERNAVVQGQLVEDLLDMSRITTGKIRLEPQPFPVAALLREAVDGVKPAADAKGIAMAFELDPFAGTVKADTTRLQQVFWNLLTNAVKFTSQGGQVVASLRRDGDYVEVSVADTGVGIAPDFLPFVFEPFRQGDTRLGRGHGGLGLGLAISKQLIELHGGTIQASSDGVGKGARLTLRLPRIAD